MPISKTIPIKIHSLIVDTVKGPLVISISKEHALAINDNLVIIADAEVSALPAMLQTNVGSFHALFGVNGSGKTKVLLNLAKGLGRNSRTGDVSVLYTRGTDLLLYLSPKYKNLRVVSNIHVAQSNDCPILPTIFYTSSPYESRRRQEHKRGENRSTWIDVSPKYGTSNRLDGLSLFEKISQIPGGFIKNAQMEVKEHLLSLSEIFSKLSEISLEHYFEGGTSNLKRLLEGRTVKKLDRDLFCTYCTVLDASSSSPTEWLILLSGVLEKTIMREIREHERDIFFMGADKLPLNIQRQILSELFVYLGFQTGISIPEARALFGAVSNFRLWRQRRKERISARLSTIQKNLADVIPDKNILDRCGKLGLITFALDGLSSGQTAISIFYAALHSALKELDGSLDSPRPFLILIDEGEMFLHPKWQQEYIAGIHNLVSTFPRIASYAHVLITTHSLIVAADAPPNSLIRINDSSTINGFGLGPQSLLESVYDVNDLHGKYTLPTLESLADYITSSSSISKNEAICIASALADTNIKDHLIQRIEEINLSRAGEEK